MSSPSDEIPNIGSTKGIEGSEDTQEPSTTGKSFESYMQPEQGTTAAKGGELTQGPSPLDLSMQQQAAGAPPTMESILSQANSNSTLIGDLQNEFHNNKDKLKLKQSQKYLLRNKLKTANDNIRTAAEATGAKVGPKPNWASKNNPVDKFLSLLSDSQRQLGQTKKMIEHLRDTQGMISPGKLLLIQTKLARVQQELEYSSVLLSKAVDDIKQMFNIQI